MAVQLGRRTTYDSIVGLKLDIEDAIYMISPFEVPLLGTYGESRGSVLGRDTTTSTKVEWLEDELVPGGDSLTAIQVTADTVITVAERGYFKTNDLVRIDNEYERIAGYGTTANTLLVERAWGSTAAQHASTSQVLILGTLPVEGDDPVAGINFQRTQPFNVTQILQDEVEVTRSEEKEAKYGVQSEAAYQMAKRLKEDAIKCERNIILGVRNEDNTNKRRSHGGLDYFIVTGVDSTTTNITEAAVLNQLQASFDRGGMVDFMVFNGTQKRKVSAWNSTDIRYARDENVRGAVVDWLDSDFGRIYFVLDRWVPTRFAFGLESQYIDMVWFDAFFTEALAKTGDRQRWQVVAEYSMKVRNEKAHFKFTALQA